MKKIICIFLVALFGLFALNLNAKLTVQEKLELIGQFHEKSQNFQPFMEWINDIANSSDKDADEKICEIYFSAFLKKMVEERSPTADEIGKENINKIYELAERYAREKNCVIIPTTSITRDEPTK